MKILIKKDGMTGLQLSEVLFDKYGIEDEKTNEVSTMLLCGIGTTEAKLERLKKAIKKIGL
jgi:arginine/lysine/ornithine decarboxylase